MTALLPAPPPSPRASRSLHRRWRPLALAAGLLCGSLTALAQTAPAAPAAAAPAASAASGPTIRAEVGKPLQAAQEAIRAGNHKEALARLAEAEAMPGLTPYEVFITQRLKGPAAFGAGDLATATQVFEQVLASPLLAAADRPAITESTVKMLLQLKDYPRAASLMKAYLDAGGSNAELRRLYPQVLSVVGDHVGVLRELAPQLAADDAARRATPEATLRMVAASQNALKDAAGYTATLERLAASTGKADYWSELTARTARRDGFAEERLRLDLYRLRRAVGVPLDAGELGDMAYRAQQVGLPAEAQALLDEAFGSGLLGKDGNALADQKLREATTRAAAGDRAGMADGEAAAQKAKDGNSATNLGLAMSGAGLHERGLALMLQGQAKGGLRRPDDALLHLGLVQWRAGKIDDAMRSFEAVKGSDGSADLARLWRVYLASPARK